VLRHLGVKHGVVAVTKADLGEPELAAEEAAELLPGVETVAVSAQSRAGIDELLAALDHFTNAVHWLQARTHYPADQALTEALADWTAARDTPTDDMDLRQALSIFIAITNTVPAAPGLADALTAWCSAVSAEHHYSIPIQAPAR
jgi:50S ribosomal subunit-associated GTPase HflX